MKELSGVRWHPTPYWYKWLGGGRPGEGFVEVRGRVRDRGGDGGHREPRPRVEWGERARGGRAGDQASGQPLRRSVAWSMVQTRVKVNSHSLFLRPKFSFILEIKLKRWLKMDETVAGLPGKLARWGAGDKTSIGGDGGTWTHSIFSPIHGNIVIK